MCACVRGVREGVAGWMAFGGNARSQSFRLRLLCVRANAATKHGGLFHSVIMCVCLCSALSIHVCVCRPNTNTHTRTRTPKKKPMLTQTERNLSYSKVSAVPAAGARTPAHLTEFQYRSRARARAHFCGSGRTDGVRANTRKHNTITCTSARGLTTSIRRVWARDVCAN